MAKSLSDVLNEGRERAGLSHAELFLRYFELGGASSAIDVEAFLYGALVPSAHDHDVIAHAINERCVELGGNHPIPYPVENESPGEEDSPA